MRFGLTNGSLLLKSVIDWESVLIGKQVSPKKKKQERYKPLAFALSQSNLVSQIWPPKATTPTATSYTRNYSLASKSFSLYIMQNWEQYRQEF
mgnify:CR=1 FL=1